MASFRLRETRSLLEMGQGRPVSEAGGDRAAEERRRAGRGAGRC